ncbi:MAG: hypothetical protein ACOC1K_01855 [Nanoarchaeota archaeon]
MEIKKIYSIPQEVVTGYRCNRCLREFYSDDSFELEEFIEINKVGGYGSKIGDGTNWSLGLCQDCFLEICGDYILVEEEHD